MIKHECWIIGTHIEIDGKSAKMAQTSSVGALIVMSIELAAMMTSFSQSESSESNTLKSS